MRNPRIIFETKEERRDKRKGIIFLLVMLFLLLIFLSYLNPLLLWDENAYLGNARSHLTRSNYTEDFRYPLLEYVIAAVWFFTGESIFAAKVIMVLFYVATIYLFYLITKPYFKKNLLLTALFAISSQMIYWGIRVYTDVFVVFFILLSFYLLRKKWFLFGGIAAAMGFLAKFTSILLIASVLLYLLYKKNLKDVSAFFTGVLIGILPWITYNIITYSNPFWDFFAQLELTMMYNPFMSPFLFIRDAFIYLNIFLIITIIKIKKICKNEELRMFLLYSAIYCLYIAFISDVKYSRYLLSILPFIYLAGWYGFSEIKGVKVRKILIGLSIFISILLLLITMIMIREEFSCNKDSGILKAINYLKKENNSFVISNVWPWFGYYNNFRIHSSYEPLKDLLAQYNLDYFVYSVGIGDLYIDEKSLKENMKLEKVFYGECGDIIYIYSR